MRGVQTQPIMRHCVRDAVGLLFVGVVGLSDLEFRLEYGRLTRQHSYPPEVVGQVSGAFRFSGYLWGMRFARGRWRFSGGHLGRERVVGRPCCR